MGSWSSGWRSAKREGPYWTTCTSCRASRHAAGWGCHDARAARRRVDSRHRGVRRPCGVRGGRGRRIWRSRSPGLRDRGACRQGRRAVQRTGRRSGCAGRVLRGRRVRSELRKPPERRARPRDQPHAVGKPTLSPGPSARPAAPRSGGRRRRFAKPTRPPHAASAGQAQRMAREAPALRGRGRRRRLAGRRARAAGELSPGAHLRRDGLPRVRGGWAARGAAGALAHSRGGDRVRSRWVPLLRQHPRVCRRSPLCGGRPPAPAGHPPGGERHPGVRPGGGERDRFRGAARVPLRDRSESTLHRRHGAGRAGVRDLAVRRACAGLPAGAAGVRRRGPPAPRAGGDRQGDRVRAASQRAGRHAVLALGPARAGYLAAGDSLRAARADLHDLRARTGGARIRNGARHPLVYLAGDISAETQGEAVAIADRLHAAIDSLGGAAAPAVLAAQRRGRAGATLGEIRQRADLVVFWAVDPGARYPRYASRYAVEPRGVAAPQGRASRMLIAVDVGERRGPAEVNGRLAIAPADEVDSLEMMRATVQGRAAGADARFQPAIDLARRMTEARYVAIVADGEPGPIPTDPARAEALVTLAQALNGPTRCALSTLRGGGNRSGADAVLTWQTGFPFAVDFARGYPSYQPQAGAATLLGGGDVDAALVVGTPATLPVSVATGLAPVRSVVIGARASAATFQPAVTIDTGLAGVHEGGTAFRMDDVPLPLRPALEAPHGALVTVRALRERLRT